VFLGLALQFSPAESCLASPVLTGNSMNSSSLQGKNAADIPTPSAGSSVGPLFRDVPSLSGRYTLRGMTFLPYIGAGFSGGYASEFDRALTPNPQPQPNANIGGLSGQGMVPNEFQMGIRIPF
jgi:hypothetical protein